MIIKHQIWLSLKSITALLIILALSIQIAFCDIQDERQFEIKLKLTSSPFFVSKYAYPERHPYSLNMFLNTLSPSFSIKTWDNWRLVLDYRWARFGTYFPGNDHVLRKGLPPRPTLVKAHYFELGIERNFSLYNDRIRLKPELGIVQRRMSSYFGSYSGFEFRHGDPTPYTRELGLKFSANIDYVLNKGKNITLGICGTYYQLPEGDTWLAGFTAGMSFNRIKLKFNQKQD